MIKIVIIEDLPLILEGIKVLINQIDDFEVVAEFANGQQFIDELPNISMDIVLCDIDMPVLDGIATTRIAISQYPDLKIIALSMHNDSKYYYEMITAGAKGFVLKQASVTELASAIREVNNGGSFFSKELLHGVILGMQNIEQELIEEKKHRMNISERESKILHLVCKGFTNKQLADNLFVSVKTIESNKAQLMKKTGATNTAGLIIWAIRNNIVKI